MLKNHVFDLEAMEKLQAGTQTFVGPQGVPRGLLMHYVLHKLSSKPMYGYELVRQIEEASGGLWRPGPGSIYPLLKKLEAAGLISSGGAGAHHRAYTITEKGRAYLEEAKRRFALAGRRWESAGRLIAELVDPKDVPWVVAGFASSQLELVRRLVESKLDAAPRGEVKYALEQYRLSLRRQLEWVEGVLSRLA